MQPGSDDVLLFNELGQLTETTPANVAVQLDGKMCTPPVRCGLLPGTQRARLLERGLPRERIIRIEELRGNPGIYLLNSVSECSPPRSAHHEPKLAAPGGIANQTDKVLDNQWRFYYLTPVVLMRHCGSLPRRHCISFNKSMLQNGWLHEAWAPID